MFDALAIAVLSLFAVGGLMRGWLTVLAQMLCWFLSLLVAVMIGSYLTDYLLNDLHFFGGLAANYGGVMEVVVTVVVFFLSLVVSAGFIRGSAIYSRENAHLELGDQVVGLFFGVLQGAAAMVIIYGICFALVGQKKDNFLEQATSTTYLDPITRQIVSNITPALSGHEGYKSFLKIFDAPPPK